MWRPAIRVVMVRRLGFDGNSAKKSPLKWLVVGGGGRHRFQRQGHHCQTRLPPWDRCCHFADAAQVVCFSLVSGHGVVGAARPSGHDAPRLVRHSGALLWTDFLQRCDLCLRPDLQWPTGSAFGSLRLVIWASSVAFTVLPVLLVMMAIERIGPGLTAQMDMIGPMSTVSWGVLLLDEPFNGRIIAGTNLVVSGVFWVTRAARV